jgi:hypothetical protein
MKPRKSFLWPLKTFHNNVSSLPSFLGGGRDVEFSLPLAECLQGLILHHLARHPVPLRPRSHNLRKNQSFFVKNLIYADQKLIFNIMDM